MSNSLGETRVLGWACPVSAGAAERLAVGRKGKAVLGVWAPPGDGQVMRMSLPRVIPSTARILPANRRGLRAEGLVWSSFLCRSSQPSQRYCET